METPRVYFVSGRGETLSDSLGHILESHGCEVHGRTPSDLAHLRFGDQLAVIQGDLVAGFWHRQTLLVGHSYGAYLLMHALAELSAFPGTVLLLSPVLGGARTGEGLYGSRPPRADRLLTLAESGSFPAAAHLEIHIGSEDHACNPALARRLASRLAGAECQVVPGAGHGLPEAYAKEAVTRLLARLEPVRREACHRDPNYES